MQMTRGESQSISISTFLFWYRISKSALWSRSHRKYESPWLITLSFWFFLYSIMQGDPFLSMPSVSILPPKLVEYSWAKKRYSKFLSNWLQKVLEDCALNRNRGQLTFWLLNCWFWIVPQFYFTKSSKEMPRPSAIFVIVCKDGFWMTSLSILAKVV